MFNIFKKTINANFCHKCGYVFKTIIGKEIEHLDGCELYKEFYCSACAPKFDRKETFYYGSGGLLGIPRVGYKFYVRQSEWRQVNEDGSELKVEKKNKSHA